MIFLTSRGSFAHLEAFLARMTNLDRIVIPILGRWAQIGRDLLADATPVYTGLAASEWEYEVGTERTGYYIVWRNFDIENGFPVAVMIKYGYTTGTGGYVPGYDFITPIVRPMFDDIANEIWREVIFA